MPARRDYRRGARALNAISLVGVVLAPAATAFGQLPSVVNNPAPSPSAPAFRISATPVMVVGGLNEDARYELLEVVDAYVSPSGQLVVAPSSQRGATEVRLFSASGVHLRTIGRKGDGPGEFSHVMNAWIDVDSIKVYDRMLRRLTVFDASGEVVRTRPDVNAGYGIIRGWTNQGDCCLRDDTYLRFMPAKIGFFEDRQFRDSSAWSLVRPATGSAAAFHVDAGDVRYVSIPQSQSAVEVPFARQSFVRLTDAGVVFGRPDRFEFGVYDFGGRLMRVVRADIEAPPVTSGMIAQERSRQMSTAGSERAKAERVFQSLVINRSLPAYTTLHAERDGTVWLGREGGGNEPQWWARFDPTGNLLGTMVLPHNRAVLRFSNGYVVLAERGGGVTTLYVHRIEQLGKQGSP